MHALAGRDELEVLWLQRRSFIQAAASWVALGGAAAAQAQQRSNIVELTGDVMLNGRRLLAGQTIESGDGIVTGPGSHLVFVIGNSSFQVRQNSRLVVERGTSLSVVGGLRLLTGAVISVWGKGTRRSMVTPTVTLGIRGTGTYTEVFPEQNFRSYFCNCYGTVEVGAGTNQVLSQSDYHQSFWAEPVAKNGQFLFPAKAMNHTDEELEALAGLVKQRTHWQIMGKKGLWNGRGYMDDEADKKHPAELLAK
ncbi:MAG: iron dicitrate transport regulator FecR [Rhodoferax sp.]|nr:iron dicitrate transport regulator FecR [Rhodoferax sp.]